jgi:hypothetical protein
MSRKLWKNGVFDYAEYNRPETKWEKIKDHIFDPENLNIIGGLSLIALAGGWVYTQVENNRDAAQMAQLQASTESGAIDNITPLCDGWTNVSLKDGFTVVAKGPQADALQAAHDNGSSVTFEYAKDQQPDRCETLNTSKTGGSTYIVTAVILGAASPAM